MIIRRQASATLTAVEVFNGDTVEFERADGSVLPIEVVDTSAGLVPDLKGEFGKKKPYTFRADCRIDGSAVSLEREVGTQASFYEPFEIGGVRIWLDAVDAIFDFLHETHGACRLQESFSVHLPPRRQARFAIQDVAARICPEPVRPWCPLPEGGLRIEECFRGEACWMGAFRKFSAHGGLDINHPKGTPLYAPIGLDDHFLYNATETGHRNNSWRGIRHWPDGKVWVLASSHMTRLTVPERGRLKAGTQYAEGAGVRVGAAEHSHFSFAVLDRGELIPLDPWILFWQMYQDEKGLAVGDAT